MLIYYRLCGIPSTNPSPIYQEDKLKLNELCLKSFVRAFKEVNPTVIFLCDHCDRKDYILLMDKAPFRKKIHFMNVGINSTCLLQYEMANKTNEKVILFQECDYIYQKNAGKILLEGVKALGMVSPYDHRNFYIDRSIHSSKCEIELVGEQHWRSTERNTMTFAILGNTFRDNFNIFYKHGYLDSDVWHDMRATGQKLWTPIPSLATHMAKDWLAPGVDWEELWNIA